MREHSLSELKAKRDALAQQIANHQPLAHSVALAKLSTYATENGMTELDLFPIDPYDDPDYDPYSGPQDDPSADYDYTPFPEFVYPDTFDYTFIEDLEQQRDKLDGELRAIQREAVARARAFIREYNLKKEDIFSIPRKVK